MENAGDPPLASLASIEVMNRRHPALPPSVRQFEFECARRSLLEPRQARRNLRPLGNKEERSMPLILWLLGVPLGLVVILWLMGIV